MPGLKLITGPTVEPITLVEARLHLKLDATGSPATHPDDSLVTALITAARQRLDARDGLLGRALVTQTWELHLDKFPSNEIRIPLPPLQSITSVKYDDVDGVEQTVASADFVVDTVSEPGWIVPVTGTSWPSTKKTLHAVRIRFVAGYGGASAVPETVKAAIKLLVGTWYANRENIQPVATIGELPMGVQALLAPYEVMVFG